MADPLVTHVLWSFGRAGTERVVWELGRRLPTRGFRVRVLSVAGGGEMVKDFREAGIEVVPGPEKANRWEQVKFLRAQIREQRPDVWHTHLGADWWGGLAGRFEKLSPWVITAHNDDRDISLPFHMIRGMAWRHANRVACVSGAVQRYAEREFGVRPERSLVIPNGIDLAGRPLRGPRSFRDVPQLVTVGRLAPQKGHRVLLEALAGIKRPWQLTVYGNGPLRGVLERHAEELGILSRVRFAGVVTDVPEQLAASDIFCFPSQWEGQGISLLEAAAAGVPILASNLPVFREAFDEQSLAFADPQNPVSWREALQKLLADPMNALRRAERARAIVQERFDVERMVDAYASLYRDLLDSRH